MEIDSAADGGRNTRTFLIGILHGVMRYGANGVETYANYYDATGRLLEQDGFDATGAKSVEIDTGGDCSNVTSSYTAGALTSLTGYSIGGTPTYKNSYVIQS